MDSAKAAVKDFLGKSGHHDTTVHETVAPAVQHETVQRTQEERVTAAIDKEVHQDHYHTSVQPVQDREVLREQHHQNVVPVEHKSIDHDDSARVKEKLAAEAAQFKSQTQRVEGERTQQVNPTVGGEHVHHHVHETIQPVVQKQTIEPHVVHTTVPIHEVHHNASQHHSASALPPVSMSDFKKQGGVLTGREERYDGFEGEPRNIGGESTTGSSGLTTGETLGHSSGHSSGQTGGLASGLTGSSATHGQSGGLASGMTGSSATHGSSTTHGQSSGLTSGSGLGSERSTDNTLGHNESRDSSTTTDSQHKSSMMDRVKGAVTGNSGSQSAEGTSGLPSGNTHNISSHGPGGTDPNTRR